MGAVASFEPRVDGSVAANSLLVSTYVTSGEFSYSIAGELISKLGRHGSIGQINRGNN